MSPREHEGARLLIAATGVLAGQGGGPAALVRPLVRRPATTPATAAPTRNVPGWRRAKSLTPSSRSPGSRRSSHEATPRTRSAASCASLVAGPDWPPFAAISDSSSATARICRAAWCCWVDACSRTCPSLRRAGHAPGRASQRQPAWPGPWRSGRRGSRLHGRNYRRSQLHLLRRRGPAAAPPHPRRWGQQSSGSESLLCLPRILAIRSVAAAYPRCA